LNHIESQPNDWPELASLFDFMKPNPRNRILAAVALVLGVAPQLLGVTYIDMTQDQNAAAHLNGGHFIYSTGQTVSGTGTYGTFVTIDGIDGVNEGYNSGTDTLMPDVGASQTTALQFSQLQVPSNNPIEGVNYFSFGMDIQESDNRLSLDELEIWVRITDLTDASTYNNLALSPDSRKVYDMDAGVDGDVSLLLNDLFASAGSGKSDLLFLIPQFQMTNGSGPTNMFIFFYYKVGEAGTIGGTNYGEGATFEEWQTVSGLTFLKVPEPSTYAAIGGVGFAIGAAMWRRARQNKQASKA
jgi:hypothetical protein